MSRLLRGTLATSPGPGGAGSILSYTQPCRKIVLTYSENNPAAKGVRTWLTSPNQKEGPVELARRWPQVEWVVKEGKSGSEPSVTGYYVNSRTKTIPLHMFPATAIPSKLHLLLSSTGRKLAGSGSRQGFNTGEDRNYKKRVVERVKGAEPVRGWWSGFGVTGREKR